MHVAVIQSEDAETTPQIATVLIKAEAMDHGNVTPGMDTHATAVAAANEDLTDTKTAALAVDRSLCEPAAQSKPDFTFPTMAVLPHSSNKHLIQMSAQAPVLHVKQDNELEAAPVETLVFGSDTCHEVPAISTKEQPAGAPAADSDNAQETSKHSQDQKPVQTRLDAAAGTNVKDDSCLADALPVAQSSPGLADMDRGARMPADSAHVLEPQQYHGMGTRAVVKAEPAVVVNLTETPQEGDSGEQPSGWKEPPKVQLQAADTASPTPDLVMLAAPGQVPASRAKGAAKTPVTYRNPADFGLPADWKVWEKCRAGGRDAGKHKDRYFEAPDGKKMDSIKRAHDYLRQLNGEAPLQPATTTAPPHAATALATAAAAAGATEDVRAAETGGRAARKSAAKASEKIAQAMKEEMKPMTSFMKEIREAAERPASAERPSPLGVGGFAGGLHRLSTAAGPSSSSGFQSFTGDPESASLDLLAAAAAFAASTSPSKQAAVPVAHAMSVAPAAIGTARQPATGLKHVQGIINAGSRYPQPAAPGAPTANKITISVPAASATAASAAPATLHTAINATATQQKAADTTSGQVPTSISVPPAMPAMPVPAGVRPAAPPPLPTAAAPRAPSSAAPQAPPPPLPAPSDPLSAERVEIKLSITCGELIHLAAMLNPHTNKHPNYGSHRFALSQATLRSLSNTLQDTLSSPNIPAPLQRALAGVRTLLDPNQPPHSVSLPPPAPNPPRSTTGRPVGRPPGRPPLAQPQQQHQAALLKGPAAQQPQRPAAPGAASAPMKLAYPATTSPQVWPPGMTAFGLALATQPKAPGSNPNIAPVPTPPVTSSPAVPLGQANQISHARPSASMPVATHTGAATSTGPTALAAAKPAATLSTPSVLSPGTLAQQHLNNLLQHAGMHATAMTTVFNSALHTLGPSSTASGPKPPTSTMPLLSLPSGVNMTGSNLFNALSHGLTMPMPWSSMSSQQSGSARPAGLSPAVVPPAGAPSPSFRPSGALHTARAGRPPLPDPGTTSRQSAGKPPAPPAMTDREAKRLTKSSMADIGLGVIHDLLGSIGPLPVPTAGSSLSHKDAAPAKRAKAASSKPSDAGHGNGKHRTPPIADTDGPAAKRVRPASATALAGGADEMQLPEQNGSKSSADTSASRPSMIPAAPVTADVLNKTMATTKDSFNPSDSAAAGADCTLHHIAADSTAADALGALAGSAAGMPPADHSSDAAAAKSRYAGHKEQVPNATHSIDTTADTVPSGAAAPANAMTHNPAAISDASASLPVPAPVSVQPPAPAAIHRLPSGPPVCLCGKPVTEGDIVFCDNGSCRVGCFHMDCVDVDDTVGGEWFCPYCKPARMRG